MSGIARTANTRTPTTAVSAASEVTFSSKTLCAQRCLAQVRRCRCAEAFHAIAVIAPILRWLPAIPLACRPPARHKKEINNHMFWTGLAITVIAAVLGIGILRTKAIQRFPRIKDIHLDVVLIVLLILGTALSILQKVADDRAASQMADELARTEALAAPPKLSVYSTQVTRSPSGLILHVAFQCDKNVPLGVIVFVATVPQDSNAIITNIWPPSTFVITGEDTMKISADGKQARLIYSQVGAGCPLLNLEVTEATMVRIESNYLTSALELNVIE